MSPYFCTRPWTSFEITRENGEVRVCCWTSNVLGNVNEGSIAEIWNGQEARELRRKMAAGDYADVCPETCPYIQGIYKDNVVIPREQKFLANFELSQREIAERRELIESLPRIWRITHSTLCNLDCVMCYQDREDKTSLPASIYEDVKKYYHVMQELLLMGGEPFAIKQFRNLIRNFPAEQYPDVAFTFITNGTIFDPEIVAMVGRLRVLWMLISIDAATPATYSQVRRKGDLEVTLNGVRTWAELGRRKNFGVVLSFTVMRSNVRELAEFVALTAAEKVSCQFTLVRGDFGDEDLIDPSVLDYETARALRHPALNDEAMNLAKTTLLDIRKQIPALKASRRLSLPVSV